MGRVLVTDAGARNVVAAVRSLGRAGLEVVTSEQSRIALAAFSKYSSRHLVYPSPKLEPERWLDWLLQELSRGDYDVVMPMDDDTVTICSQNREQISEYSRVPVPDFATLKKAADKSQTLRIASELNIDCPKTIFIDDPGQVESAADELGYPLVIKPRESSGSRGIVYVTDKAQLRDSYLRVHEQYPFPMLQQYIAPGGQACGVFLLFNRDSELRAVFAHKRLREFPVKGGPSTLRESIYAPELVATAVRLLEAMGWYGVAMAEFKQDPADGRFKLMEVNPRFWGSLELSILAGVDFPFLLYRMATEGDIEPVTEYKTGVRCRWLLPGDILHFLFNPKRFKLEPSFFDFSADNRHDDFLSLEDPGPGLGFFLVVLRNLFNLRKWRDVFSR